MVSKVDEFKTVVLAFGVGDIEMIINALRVSGNDTLACDIITEAYGECDCGDNEGSGSDHTLVSLTFDIDTSALEVATVKLTALADAAQRAANEAERLEGVLK